MTAWLKRLPIAHRGLHNSQAPENSLAAFQRAVEAGYGIELDVQLSADGHVVVFHDYNLKRMTGLDREVKDLDWPHLKELQLAGTDQGIPLFKDVLALVRGRTPLLIEIKNDGKTGRLEKTVIEELRGYAGEFAIQSFNPFVLLYFRKHAPGIVRGQLSGPFKGQNLALIKVIVLKYLLLNFLSRPAFVSYAADALPQWFARRLRRKGLYLLAWVVSDVNEYAQAVKIFDNVIFEDFSVPKFPG
ncbi:MAG: glycerophosphodiester phosphodiesterase [Desulfitobacteriaceae bacterium]|nr:glycerophosphodiester phosphodiesterase [Desulfitobacteriaceae bacterium]